MTEVLGFSWIAGATVAHVAEYERRGAGTPEQPWRYGWESICSYKVFTAYAAGGNVRVHYSRHELPPSPWCRACLRIIRGRAGGWAEAGLIDLAAAVPT